MSDEEKKSPLPDSWFQDAPAPGTPPGKKGKPSTGQDQEEASDQPAPVADQPEESESQPKAETRSEDDLLDDVRRELVQEEETKPKSKWRGIFKRKKKPDQTDNSVLAVEGKVTEPPTEAVDVSRVGDRAHIPTEEPLRRVTGPLSERRVTGPLSERRVTGPLSERRATGPLSESATPSAPEAPAEEDVLKSILGIDATNLPEDSTEVMTPEEEEAEVIDRVRRHEILRPEEGEEKVADIEDIREEALKDYSAEPLQPEEGAEVTVGQRSRILFRGLRPVEKILLFAVLGVIVIAGVFAVNAIMSNLPAAAVPPTVDPNIPFPVGVTLPGGWQFNLEKGQVVEGRWDPTGPEWLEGTELCKWVALPWSLQLEAVVRTLEKDDPVELAMSNADHLTFKVQSLRKVGVDEVGALEQKPPCLFVILVNPDADTRLVLTAVP